MLTGDARGVGQWVATQLALDEFFAGYNIVAIPLAAGVLAAAGVLLKPAIGAILMSLPTVIVPINARFLRMPGGA